MIILLLSGVSILLFTVVVLQQLKMRRVAALQSDITGCITNAVQTLEHGLSAFSSGDMTIQLPDPVCLPKSSTGKALYRGVSDCIEDFQSITAVPARRICFSGANSYQEGVLAGQRIAEAMNSKGTVASFIPLFTQINHVMRMKGCLDYLAAQHPNIQSIGVFESQGNQDAARIAYQSMVKKHGQVDMLYITDGHTPAAFVEQIKEDKHRNTRVIAFDAIPENVALLKQGKIECLVEQNSFAQSYNALIHLYNHCESSWKPVLPKLFMKPLAIDRDNYTTYWDDARNERIMKDEELAMLAEPVRNTSGRTYRFGLILPLSTGFFAGLGKGAEAARARLAECNVSVDIVDAFQNWDTFGSIQEFQPVIQRYQEQGYDGFATVVVDPRLVEVINNAAAQGMKVTTFNTEPFNFREIIMTMIKNVERLAESSQGLASAAEESSRANSQIGTAVGGMSDSMSSQKQRIDANEGELNQLNTMIEDARSAVTEYRGLVERMNKETTRGSSSMEQSYQETEALKKAIDNIVKELNAFNEKLANVRKFAGVISSLAESTNVLAINASVQAARAGTAGNAFAVVAGEVRSLAENSHASAESIHAVVDEVTQSMKRIVEISARETDQVALNLEKARDAQESFQTIASVISDANSSIRQIEGSMQGILATGETVKKNMDEIEQMSNHSVDRIQEISVSVEELGNQSAELSTTANELREMAVNQEIVFSELSVEES